ncbi:MAG: hypothetical protein ACQERD_00790 [Campylobacterota bacterium]
MTKDKYLKNLSSVCKKLEKFTLYKCDEKPKELKKAFDLAYDYDLFKLYSFDKETQEELKLQLFEKLTLYSGSLSFLGIQILAANSIMAKNEFARKDKFFAKKCGIAINHLRMPKTAVKAKKYKDGYLLNGELTWASGYKIFDKLLIGFHLDDYECEVVTSFKEKKGFKIVSRPKTFVAMALNTVNIKLTNYFVKKKNIVSKNPIGNYTKNKSLSKTVHYCLYSLGNSAIKNSEDKTLKRINKEKLEDIKQRFLSCNDGELLDKQRVELFYTVLDIITISMINYGGKSVLLEKNLHRYYRELIMFNSNGLNTKIKELFIKKSL